MSQIAMIASPGTVAPDIEKLTGDAGGAVGPDGAFNVDILGGTGVVVTGNPATNTLTIDAAGVPQSNIIYVGKHGNDSNMGTTIETAVLTFTQANVLVTAATPAIADRYAIVCLDSGSYTEATQQTFPRYCNIIAPSITYIGSIRLTGDSVIHIGRMEFAGNDLSISTNAGDRNHITIDEVVGTGAAGGIYLYGTDNTAYFNRIITEDGAGLVFSDAGGDGNSAVGNMVEKTGTNYAVRASKGHIKINKIYTAVGGIGLYVESGGAQTVTAEIGAIVGFDTGIESSGFTTSNLYVGMINCTAAYIVGANTTVRLYSNSITGTKTVNGTLNIFQTTTEGTANQLLTSNGAGTVPTYQTPVSSITWQAIGASGALVNNIGYLCTTGAALSFSLPATSAVGTVIALSLVGSTSWTITQGANQYIIFGSSTTTVGAGGSLASTAAGDTVYLVAMEADLGWVVVSSIGNITLV